MATIVKPLDAVKGYTSAETRLGIPVAGVGGVTSTRGYYSDYPVVTPKYRSTPERAHETIARMHIPFLGFKKDRLSREFEFTETELGLVEPFFSTGYIDFLLQSAQEAQSEHVQVVDLLSDNFAAFFFGAKPKVFSYNALLINSVQDDWRAAFHIVYEKLLRGTKLARMGLMVSVAYDNVVATGALLDMTQVLSAPMELAVQVSFSLLVKNFYVEPSLGRAASLPLNLPNYVNNAGTFAAVPIDRVNPTTRTATESATTVTGATAQTSVPEKGADGSSDNLPVYAPADDQTMSALERWRKKVDRLAPIEVAP